MAKHCCETMTYWVNYKCPEHQDVFACPDNIIYFCARPRAFEVIVHDGGSSYIVTIQHKSRTIHRCHRGTQREIKDDKFALKARRAELSSAVGWVQPIGLCWVMGCTHPTGSVSSVFICVLCGFLFSSGSAHQSKTIHAIEKELTRDGWDLPRKAGESVKMHFLI